MTASSCCAKTDLPASSLRSLADMSANETIASMGLVGYAMLSATLGNAIATRDSLSNRQVLAQAGA